MTSRTSRAPAAQGDPRRSLLDVARKVERGERLDGTDALAVLHCDDLPRLSELATLVRRRQHPRRGVTYIVDRNINPTNVCVARCSFCAFDRLPGDPEGYVLSHEEIFAKVDELLELDGVQILLQGGHHPRLGIEYYEDLFRALRSRYPRLHVHGLSPAEVVHISRLSRLEVADVLERLRAAGLDSIPGGGGEILVDRVRRLIAPRKVDTEQWLDVMRQAHRQGMRTTATMMYGHVETPSERIEHLLRLRELQDETGGFTAFICWPFQPGGSELQLPKTGAHEYLRMNAVARLVLDNFDNLQASFVTQGSKLAQLALHFGCNDFGGTMLEENVVSAAGTRNLASIAEIEHVVREAGFEPRRRNMYYAPVGDSAVGDACEPAALWRAGRRQGRRERAIERKLESGERLGFDDGMFLMGTPDLAWLGRLANDVRERLHGNDAFFIVNRHLNPSNFCVYSCSFCAYARKPGQAGGYRLSLERIRSIARDQLEDDLREIHVVGGLDPELPYEYYLDVLRVLRDVRPDVHLKAYTMIEIDWLSRIGRKPIPEVLDDLVDAGLGSCPGGGVEVLSERVHRALFPQKLTPQRWLETAMIVQRKGIRMNATLLYGHIERAEERVRHLLQLRELQDECGGFMAFVPLAFHPENTALAHRRGPTGVVDLRQFAVARLLLDNFAHIKAYWVMQGLDVAQVALRYGADDMDGTVVEERITHAAGARTPLGLTKDELIRTIREAGREPVERDTLYSKRQPVP